ncbi:helix-turn-helix transcriptional regulator [Paenibacillus sp. BK720]|uniref:helix-turn-helix domain-containing protein n=1 Tax=Paenibacillus sp. BK720 TaxID=2587092 RepID=UPI001421EDD8|nr:helix-turn-helix transcriptional regulator [Paenibacillus sp. BK720]NIK70560.1 transcriptional regulator with XRE-family HTH domain [Paenibacillus sp. BK720]
MAVIELIGLQYIADTFQMEYKTVAERVGVSKQTFQDWIKGRRKVPQQRLEALSRLFGITEVEWFQKELTDSEKTEIQIHYFQQSDVIEEVEDTHVDDDGLEHTVKYSVSQNKSIIDFLQERSAEDRLLERTEEAVRNDHAEGKDNKVMLEQLLTVIEGKATQRRALELVLYALTEYGQDEWGGVRPQFIKFDEKGFFDKFNILLKDFGLSND